MSDRLAGLPPPAQPFPRQTAQGICPIRSVRPARNLSTGTFATPGPRGAVVPPPLGQPSPPGRTRACRRPSTRGAQGGHRHRATHRLAPVTRRSRRRSASGQGRSSKRCWPAPMCRVPANNCSPLPVGSPSGESDDPAESPRPVSRRLRLYGPSGQVVRSLRSDLVGQHVQTVELGRLGGLDKRREGAVEHADAARPPNEHLSSTVKRTPRISPFPGSFAIAPVLVSMTPKLQLPCQGTSRGTNCRFTNVPASRPLPVHDRAREPSS